MSFYSCMSFEELKEEFISLSEIIETLGCFGFKDVLRFEAVKREIENRGGKIITRSEIEKRGAEE